MKIINAINSLDMFRCVVVSIILFNILFVPYSNAQSVGIGTSTPDPSAALHVSDSNKGILLPRLTTSQRLSIPNPADALLVFDTNTNSFWWKGDTQWIELISTNIGLRDTDGDTSVDVEQTEDEDEVVISITGQEQARFSNNQLYLKNNLSLGTTSQRGMLTLRGPNDLTFGPTMYMYGASSDQEQSGRIRFVEGTSNANWRGAYMHYNGASNLLHLGTHNNSDNLSTSDFNALTVKRVNGFVGINNENPQERLSVSGDVKFDNDNSIMIKTDQNQITLTAGSSSILIDASGNISISSPSGNIDMNASNISITASNDLKITAGRNFDESVAVNKNTVIGGNMTTNVSDNISLTTDSNISISANQAISQVAATDFSLQSGNDFEESVGGSMVTTVSASKSITAGSNISTNSNQSISITAGSSLLLDANNQISTTAGTKTIIQSGSNTDISGALLLLNASTSAKGAARVGDKTLTPTSSPNGNITTGSTSVLIGN